VKEEAAELHLRQEGLSQRLEGADAAEGGLTPQRCLGGEVDFLLGFESRQLLFLLGEGFGVFPQGGDIARPVAWLTR
jgi:hypothetical protein